MPNTSKDPLPPPTITTRSGRTRRQRTIFSPDVSHNIPAQSPQPSTTKEVPVVRAPPKRAIKNLPLVRVVEVLEEEVEVEDEVESSEEGEVESSEEGGRVERRGEG